MGSGSSSLPKKAEEFLGAAQFPLDAPFMLMNAAVNLQTLTKFRIQAGDDVKDENGNPILFVIGIDEAGNRLQGSGERLDRLVTIVDTQNQVVAAWQTMNDFTTMYARTQRAAGVPAASGLPIWKGAADRPELFPFAQIDGGRQEGKKNKPFRICLATGADANNRTIYDQGTYFARGCGGNFWRIHKGAVDGPGACIVGPARQHLDQRELSGAVACLVGPGMDPILLLTACLIKNMNVIGPILKGLSIAKDEDHWGHSEMFPAPGAAYPTRADGNLR